MSRRKRAKHEAHVRLYRHELDSEAYRSLSTDARALLVEMRALYDGTTNRIFMSLREIMRRLGVGRCRAEKARDELLDRGFMRLMEKATFHRKTRHAPVYCLTNEPTEPGRMGSTVPKDYMKWRAAKKSSVLMTSTDGVDGQHRGPSEVAGKGANGVDDQHREDPKPKINGVDDQHTDSLPGTTPEKPSPGWEVHGHTWRCRNGLLLNAQCPTCRVWITADGQEFNGGRHRCDVVSKKSDKKALDRVPGGRGIGGNHG